MLLLKRFYKDGVPGLGTLLLEGALVALAAALFSAWLFPSEASLILVALAAISTEDSMARLLGWNRSSIQDQGTRPARANGRLAVRILALFGGTFVGFSVLALALPIDSAQALFVRQLGDYPELHFPDLAFGRIDQVLVHNVYVLLFFLVIALPFRQGGVMLTVAWNASVWAASFGIMARRWTEQGGPHVVEGWLRVIGATATHMVLEAAAYVLAGLAGVFLSQAYERHGWDSDMFVAVARSAGLLMLAAAGLLLAGASWEAWVAPQLVDALAAAGPGAG